MRFKLSTHEIFIFELTRLFTYDLKSSFRRKVPISQICDTVLDCLITIVFFFYLATNESRSRLSKPLLSTSSALQFPINLNDDVDDGIEVDADDSAGEEDDQVFRTPINAVSAPSSPATITTVERPLTPPQIEVYSVYNDVNLALYHLNNKMIATYTPETMRGGGLLVCFNHLYIIIPL